MASMAPLLICGLLLLQALNLSDELAQARASIIQGDFASAELRLERIAREFPRSSEVHFLIGELRASQKRSNEAEEHLQEAIQLNPQRIDPYLSLAKLYQNLGHPQLALGVLQKGNEVSPDNADVLQEMAKIHLLRQEFAASLKLLDRIPPRSANLGYWDTLGKANLLAGNLSEAATAYERYLELEQDSVRTLQVLSALALKQEDPQRAWDFIAQARRIAPCSPQILYEFARISELLNLSAEAVMALRFLVLMEPDKPDYLWQLGSGLLQVANYPRAVDSFSLYVEARPDEALGRAMLGQALYLASRFDEAEQQFLVAQELDPALVDAVYYLGMIAYTRGRDEKAEEYLQAAITEAAEHGRAHLGLGKLYLRLRRYSESEQSLREASRLMPEDHDVCYQLSRLYSLQGNRERALEELQKFNELKEAYEKREAEAMNTPYSNPER
jgi:tetratricopeptide (TPR) repeat protein